ncbi:hypothetical protein EJD97_007185, partial [Solanum chilense]
KQRNVSRIFILKSLEKLGDYFLRYAISIQPFKTYENYHEGLIKIKKKSIISNDALFNLKVSMHEHIVHALLDLQRQIFCTFEDFEKLDLVSTFGWETETSFPNVLVDVIEYFAIV